MARANRLTTAMAVQKMVTPGRHVVGDGLYFQVRSADSRSWLFRYMLAGRSREMGLGAYPEIGLSEARQKAAEAKRLTKDGKDPLNERKAAKEAQIAENAAAVAAGMTFEQVAALYIADKSPGWRNEKHVAQWSSTLKEYAFKEFGAVAVSDVDTGMVMKVLRPIWTEKPETAGRVRGRIEMVLDYAKANGWRQGENPARWRGHIENMLPKRSKVKAVRHHPALAWKRTASFMAALSNQVGMSARCLKFTILTATRSGESIGARWEEIDFAEKVWTVPAERMKAGKEHKVPLSPQALAVLESVSVAGRVGYMFPGAKEGRSLSNMAMGMLLRDMRDDTGEVWRDAKGAAIVPHGFRSTFRDWVAEATDYDSRLGEAALAHTVKDKVEAAYQRGDLLEKRRLLMSEWGKFCEEGPASNVVQLRA